MDPVHYAHLFGRQLGWNSVFNGYMNSVHFLVNLILDDMLKSILLARKEKKEM